MYKALKFLEEKEYFIPSYSVLGGPRYNSVEDIKIAVEIAVQEGAIGELTRMIRAYEEESHPYNSKEGLIHSKNMSEKIIERIIEKQK